MKNFLLLFLVGTTCTISAQRLNKAIPLRPLNTELITHEERAVLDKKSIIPDYSSFKEGGKIKSWINISQQQVRAGGSSLISPNIPLLVYPDTTVKSLSQSGRLISVSLSGFGQTINFNSEALGSVADFQFITSRDTVNIDTMRLNFYYLRSKTMVATKSDSLIVSFGVVPRDYREDWVATTRIGVFSPTIKNPNPVLYLPPKATGNTAPGFQKVFTGTGVNGFTTVSVALVNGTIKSTIPVNKKLIKDSLFIYYATYKPAELAPVNDTIFDWNDAPRAKYSSFRLLTWYENAPGENTRYFDDQNLTTVNGLRYPISYTLNFFQFQESRYGLSINNEKTTWMGINNALGISTDFKVSGNSTLSTNEKLAPKFAMAPNPANNTLNINFKEVGKKSIEIIDMVGRKINQYKANNANSFSTNDISSLPNGFYFVKITNDLGISSTKKLIVNHH